MIKQISIDVYCESEVDVAAEVTSLIEKHSSSIISVLGCDTTACWEDMQCYKNNIQI